MTGSPDWGVSRILRGSSERGELIVIGAARDADDTQVHGGREAQVEPGLVALALPPRGQVAVEQILCAGAAGGGHVGELGQELAPESRDGVVHLPLDARHADVRAHRCHDRDEHGERQEDAQDGAPGPTALLHGARALAGPIALRGAATEQAPVPRHVDGHRHHGLLEAGTAPAAEAARRVVADATHRADPVADLDERLFRRWLGRGLGPGRRLLGGGSARSGLVLGDRRRSPRRRCVRRGRRRPRHGLRANRTRGRGGGGCSARREWRRRRCRHRARARAGSSAGRRGWRRLRGAGVGAAIGGGPPVVEADGGAAGAAAVASGPATR